MDFSEKWGKDVDDATRLALEDLKLSVDEVTVIVLEAPTKGFLGIGAKLAKVRVEKKKPLTQEEIREKARAEEASKREKERAFEMANREKARMQQAAPVKQEATPGSAKVAETPRPEEKRSHNESREDRFNGRPRRDDRPRREDRPREDRPRREDRPKREERKPIVAADLTEVKDSRAEHFLIEMTQKMGLELEIRVYEGEEAVYVNIEGKDSGTIIGKRGQTLDAVQYLTSLVVNRDKEKHSRVVVNAENYREKREKTLEQLAKRLSDKVAKSGKSVRLEPMNPYERKVIHATLQTSPIVTTRSEGEEPYRRVIIELK